MLIGGIVSVHRLSCATATLRASPRSGANTSTASLAPRQQRAAYPPATRQTPGLSGSASRPSLEIGRQRLVELAAGVGGGVEGPRRDQDELGPAGVLAIRGRHLAAPELVAIAVPARRGRLGLRLLDAELEQLRCRRARRTRCGRRVASRPRAAALRRSAPTTAARRSRTCAGAGPAPWRLAGASRARSRRASSCRRARAARRRIRRPPRYVQVSWSTNAFGTSPVPESIVSVAASSSSGLR